MGDLGLLQGVSKLGKFMSDRVEKLYSWKIKAQPYVVVCGSNVDEVDASYVVVNKTTYLISSPQRAQDVCFKLIHALHAEYSIESHRIWMLIQKELHKLDTPFDNLRKDTQLPLLLRKFK